MATTKSLQPVGIVSYGAYVPRIRLAIGTLAEQWQLSPELENAYRLNGRQVLAVNDIDEDTITLAIEASERALLAAPAAKPTSLLIGSESHPYAVKASGAVVAEALGLNPASFTVDLEFACKGGTAALFLTLGLVGSQQIEEGLAIGADCPQSAPGSILEASVGCGAAAFLVGSGSRVIASIKRTASATSDLSDFWRRDGSQFPSVVGKFSAQEGYVEHTMMVIDELLSKSKLKAEDCAYLCLHQPYQSLPLATAKKMGFKRNQVQTGITAARIGNTYSSACLLSLCAALEKAEVGDKILLASFGSGAGSDGFLLQVEDPIKEFRQKIQASYESIAVQMANEHCQQLTYGQYAYNQSKLRE